MTRLPFVKLYNTESTSENILRTASRIEAGETPARIIINILPKSLKVKRKIIFLQKIISIRKIRIPYTDYSQPNVAGGLFVAS